MGVDARGSFEINLRTCDTLKVSALVFDARYDLVTATQLFVMQPATVARATQAIGQRQLPTGEED